MWQRGHPAVLYCTKLLFSCLHWLFGNCTVPMILTLQQVPFHLKYPFPQFLVVVLAAFSLPTFWLQKMPMFLWFPTKLLLSALFPLTGSKFQNFLADTWRKEAVKCHCEGQRGGYSRVQISLFLCLLLAVES